MKRTSRLATLIALMASQFPGGVATQPAQPYRVKRGSKITATNNYGPITVTGWQRDTIEAEAAGSSGTRPVEVKETISSPGSILVVVSTASSHSGGMVHLRLKVPTYAEIDSIRSRRGGIEVSDITGPTTITNRSGDIRATGIQGDLVARTISGGIRTERVSGLNRIATASGDVSINDANGDVRVVTASGNIEVNCANGRVEAAAASGSIRLMGSSSDIDAHTATGDIDFYGSIRPEGRYRLKTVAGSVRMRIHQNTPGFVATLSSYSGRAGSEFPLRDNGAQTSTQARTLAGRFGDGGAEIILETFKGTATLSKLATEIRCK
jgi:hypothetical protein